MGISSQKNLGQNFLIDKNIAHKAMHWAEIRRGDKVVEIGPGLGMLTGILLEHGAEVYAVELDKTLYTRLQKEFPCDSLHLIHGDGVRFPLGGLESLNVDAVKVVSNLPYAISSPWMENLLQCSPLPSRMVLLMQMETAQRFLSSNDPRSRGAIGIRLCSAYGVVSRHRVSPNCFYPIPRVNSMLLCLGRKDVPFLFSAVTYRHMRSLFQWRRKQLCGIIRRWPDEEVRQKLLQWFISLGKTTIRVEDISVTQWQQLQMYLS
jgi:16S rRNA (adenine1518-N6/adenine1519-N6)-dimethyltransferase